MACCYTDTKLHTRDIHRDMCKVSRCTKNKKTMHKNLYLNHCQQLFAFFKTNNMLKIGH